MGTACRLLSRFKNVSSNSTRLLSSSAAALIRRSWTHSSDESEDSDGENSVYKRTLRMQRPSSVRYQAILHNHVSLIGKIGLPLKECNTSNGRFGVHTLLKVEKTRPASRSFRIMLFFWDEIAEMSVQHLKLKDAVYVSGVLRFNRKADKDDNLISPYSVTVEEMNFICQYGPDPASQNFVESDALVPATDSMQKHRDRLHLWHIFFRNPYEWWDNRTDKKKNKCSPNSPDFKHKDTGEVLWLRDRDPPWIKKQLQLQDSRLIERPSGREGSWRSPSPLIYDDD